METFVILLACLVLSNGFSTADGADAQNPSSKDADKAKEGEPPKAGENDKANRGEDKEKKEPLAKQDKKEENVTSTEAEKTNADEEAEKIKTEHEAVQEKKHPAKETENSEPGSTGTEQEKPPEKENGKSNANEKDKIKAESVTEPSENKTAETQQQQQQQQQQQEVKQQPVIPAEPQTEKPVESSKPLEAATAEKTHLHAAEEAGTHEANHAPALTDDQASVESKSVWNCILNELPQELRVKVVSTDEAEAKLLESNTASLSTDSIHNYNTAKEAERRLLKDLLSELGLDADNILAAYKALRKGDVWKYVKLDPQYKAFFEQTSSARTQFETLKADEVKSLDSYLSSSPKTSDVVGDARALAGEVASENQDDVIERIARAAGVDASGSNVVTVRGDVGTNSTTVKADGVLGGGSGVAASEEVANKTTVTAEPKSVNDRRKFVKFAIICSVVGVLSAAFITVIACRKRIAKWRTNHKATQYETDMEHLHTNDQEYSRIEGDETDTREESANFSMLVATLGETDHNNRPWRETVKSFPIHS